jgi:phosphate transport system protein
MSTPHTVKAFDQELATLARSVEAMGNFAAAQFDDGLFALLHGDLARAERVIEQDRQVDALRRDVTANVALVIAKRQPVASDLNEILADLRISEDLERVGDLGKNIAKRTLAIGQHRFPEEVSARLKEFGAVASAQLRLALDAYVRRDAEQALAARRRDETLDRLHTQLFRDFVSQTGGNHIHVLCFVHLLFCAKNIERVGDHATHIAEAAYQLVEGHPPAERQRLDESSTISDGDPRNP